jgi:hypothetical protein
MTWAAAVAAIVAAVAMSARVIYAHRAKVRQREIDAETLRLKMADKREESIVTVLLDELDHERADRHRQEQRIDVLVDEIKRRRSERPTRHTEPEIDPDVPARDTDPQTPSGRPKAP